MAAKPSTAAEKALQKIQDQVTCGICLEPYQKPKLLKCFHVYCEQCLQCLVRGRQEGQSILCPQCCQSTPLPVGGVMGLQGAFYIHSLFEVKDALKQVSSSDQTMCNKYTKREAVGFCCTCGFVCGFCKETHQYWDNLKTHEINDLDTLTRDVTTVVPLLKQTLLCSRHHNKEADLYCEMCEELICRDCIVRVHRDHEYDLVSESFAKQEKVIVDSLRPVGEQISVLVSAVESVNTQSAAVKEQKITLVAEIHIAMEHLRQALKVRETELVGQAEQMAQQKLKTLAAQQDGFELRLGQLRSCHNFVEEIRRTCRHGEILKSKNSLAKQVKYLTTSFRPESLALAVQADMKFAHNLPPLINAFQMFGKVYSHPVVPEKCCASGEGINAATSGQTVVVSVEALDRKGKACFRLIDSLRCELVASDHNSIVRGTVKRRNQNIYDISYQPQVTGEHKLHILIEEQPIMNSPFTVTVLPNFTAPANIIGGIARPFGIAVREGGEVAVASCDGGCLTIISDNGEKKSFGVSLNATGFSPISLAIDKGGDMLVVDHWGHCIQQLSSTGKHFRTVGIWGNGPLQFQRPRGVVIHPHTGKVYVADCNNHRIQVMNSDLTYSSSFGTYGSNNGEFLFPYDICTDKEGNVYVADGENHRIQVFTVNGEYLWQFGKKGRRDGELNQPGNIAISSCNIVCIGEWGNNRISIFSTDGGFIKCFGGHGKGPAQFDQIRGLSFDSDGNLYASEKNNDRIQIFS